jgi:release factor glutamine methyltransferase
LRVAQRNAEHHGIADRLTLLESDCFSALDASLRFDLIVSNPPYISEDEMKNLQREVNYEPRTALAAGPDGLAIIRRLLVEARPFLRPGGHFVFEIGFEQSEAVQQLIDPRTWEVVKIRADLQKIPRTFVLRGV